MLQCTTDHSPYSKMAEKEEVETSKKKQVRQPPSVPFLWEEKPGIAKKDWKPEVSSVTPTLVASHPVKLVAMVPFSWEEKPGKPLSCFSQPPEKSSLTTPIKLLTFPSPLADSQGYDNHKYGSDDGDKDSEGDKQEGMFDLDLESFRFETNDSFSSAPSLMANCLLSTVAISTAVPVQKTSPTNDTTDEFEELSSTASETDSSTSSYATGISSLAGAEFLECLFPLYPPNSGFLGNIRYSKKGALTPQKPNSRDFDHETKSSLVIRRPPTLGELIMMSRRRSCLRKAVQMRKQSLSMELTKKKACGCFIFGTSTRMIEGFLRKRQPPRLKLI